MGFHDIFDEILLLYTKNDIPGNLQLVYNMGGSCTLQTNPILYNFKCGLFGLYQTV